MYIHVLIHTHRRRLSSIDTDRMHCLLQYPLSEPSKPREREKGKSADSEEKWVQGTLTQLATNSVPWVLASPRPTIRRPALTVGSFQFYVSQCK